MSEPALISPLLDGFVMGDPISDHDGVCCCPAMELETDKKYIVKVISIPAKQEKLAALLLAGAFADRESAIAYFKELADDVIQEAELLQKLSRFEGFAPYEKWQLMPMEPETGYDVYLLSSYRPTLAAQLERNDMTHLAAVNLGLDLCAALSVCRRFGYLYADLQPNNVYICNNGEYRIGDLGFISLASLPYASLPEKYHSVFTPPEISDAYSALNATMDTYAVGLILYMAYNDGLLPEPGDVLHAPRHADHELATIIMKACDQNPDVRWQDPMQMGQALINYLQRNSVNDTPIVPPPAPEKPEAPEEAVADETSDPLDTAQVIAQVDEALDIVPSPETESAEEEETQMQPDDLVSGEIVAENESSEESPTETVEAEASDDATVSQAAEEVPAKPVENAASVDALTEEASLQTDSEDIAPEDDMSAEETEAEAPAPETSVQNETQQMLAQADDLIAHELPSPVVAPEPIEVTLPAPRQETEESTELTTEASDGLQKTEAESAPDNESEPEEPTVPVIDTETAPALEDDVPAPAVKKRHKGLIISLVCAIVLLAAFLGGYLFYTEYYLQTIDGLTVNGSVDRLEVLVDTDADHTLLTVLCTDTYGTTQRASVVDGIATFENLSAGMNYKLQVRIDGFHQLLGTTSTTYTTAQLTTISDFTAAIGNEDGSVILSFTVQGPDTQQWHIRYNAPGEEEQLATFAGHMVTLTGLTVGKTYNFTLEPAESLYLSGDTTLEFVPSNVIVAQQLQLHGFQNGGLYISWSTPEGESVSSWSIRCYNDSFDQTVTTGDQFVILEGLDNAASYTIEVTADGMTVNARTFLSAGSITFKEIILDDSVSGILSLSWSFEGEAPADGWLLLYTVDGCPTQVIQCKDDHAVISPLVPGGKYTMSIQPSNGATVFGGECSYEAPAASAFSGYGVDSETISMKMCITPAKENWDRWDVKDSDFTTSFGVGVSASFTMRLLDTYSTSDDEIVTLYVIRDANGDLVSTATESRTWTNMWYRSRGKLTIPFMPETAGNYTIEIYFNFAHVATHTFSIVE